MASAPPIKRPADLAIPDSDLVQRVLRLLRPAEARRFLAEMMEAIEQSRHTNDLRPVQVVLVGWVDTLVVRTDPGYRQSLRRARERPHPDHGVSVEELRRQFA
jgi:hypothetical protein